MARTIGAIKKIMTDEFINDPLVIEAYGLVPGNTFEQEFSIVSLENTIFDNVAFGHFAIDNLMDFFKEEIEAEMAKQKVHSKEWYRQKALGFLFGIPVIAGTDVFDTTGLTDEQLAAAAVIKQAACTKMISSNGYGILRIKVATADNTGILQAVPEAQFNALKHYILRYVVDAGTQVKITTGDADDLRLTLEIYFDPAVLSSAGQRLDGTDNTPVQDAINDYLQGIEFNGMFIRDDLVKKIRAVKGVVTARVISAASKYGDFTYETVDTVNAGEIGEIRVADSGYMKIDSDELFINWIPMPE